MGQHLVAIDLSATAVRLVTLEVAFRRAQLVSAVTVPIEPGQERAELWARVRAALPRDIESVVVGAEGKTSSTRLLSFPFGDPKKVEAALSFELENQVPYDLEATAVAWHATAVGAHHSQVLAALAPKAQLASLLGELSAAGLEPRAVVLPAAALAELVTPGPEPIAVLALGASVSHLAVVKHGLLFARTLRVGGEAVDKKLAQRFSLDLEAARKAKETELRLTSDTAVTSPDARAAHDAAVQGLLAITREVATTFKSLPVDDLPRRLVITGGLSRLPGLAEVFADKLAMPVSLLDVPAALAPIEVRADQALGPEYGVAAGMALSLMRKGRALPLNFRRGELAFQGDLDVYRGEFTRIAVGVAAVLVLAIFGSIVQFSMVTAEERQLTQGFCEATKKIVGQEICEPSRALATMRQSPGAAEGLVIPSYSASSLINMMSKLLGTDVDVQFQDLEARVDGRVGEPDRINGKGEAATFETIEQVANKLKTDRCVKAVDVSRQKKTQDGRVEFQLAVQIECPVGVQPGSGAALAAAAAPEGATP